MGCGKKWAAEQEEAEAWAASLESWKKKKPEDQLHIIYVIKDLFFQTDWDEMRLTKFEHQRIDEIEKWLQWLTSSQRSLPKD